jgi:hypothetical protein
VPPDVRKGFAFPLRSVLFCEDSALDMGGVASDAQWRSARKAIGFPHIKRRSRRRRNEYPHGRLLALSSILTIIAYPVFLLV